ncbi:MAG TPA: DNA-processing protein DprA [Candidatus Eremiobacteraceae bacterium]|nr:DNA-processing protein DprA [Candidatus Eremiobacteraceae bacterium]
MSDDLDRGWLLAVAGAAVWSPRPLATWFAAMGDARSIARQARAAGAFVPSGAEPLSSDTLARLAALDDKAAFNALRAAEKCAALVLTKTDPRYPARLRELCDAPHVLYCLGDPAVAAARSVGIVGSRAASSYGRSVAATFARDAAIYGATVVSGLARGVDAAAHSAAVESGGKTVAVIGSGLAALYPPYHSLLADEIVNGGGAVLSEFPPAMVARPHHFPMRNRIVAALADGVIVTEAAHRSGALITARLADEYGRRVFAVPGDIDRPTSAGTNALIRDGVTAATSMADVAEVLGWNPVFAAQRSDQDHANTAIDPLLALLGSGAFDIDELSIRSGSPAAEVAAQLTILELRGVVERRIGGTFAAVTFPITKNDVRR